MKRALVVAATFLAQLRSLKAFCSTTLHFCAQLLPPDEENVVLTLFETIKKAAVPLNVDSAIAVGLAEAVAGGVGGLASRAVSAPGFFGTFSASSVIEFDDVGG